MATEPTKEAIQAHQRALLEEAEDVADGSIVMPSDFGIEIRLALRANESGDLDDALDIAKRIVDESRDLRRRLEEMEEALETIDEEPAPADGKDGAPHE